MKKFNYKLAVIIGLLLLSVGLVFINFTRSRDLFLPQSQSALITKPIGIDSIVDTSSLGKILVPTGFRSKEETFEDSVFTFVENNDIKIIINLTKSKYLLYGGDFTGKNPDEFYKQINELELENQYVSISGDILRDKTPSDIDIVGYYYYTKEADTYFLYSIMPDYVASARVNDGLGFQIFFKNIKLSSQKQQEYLQLADKVLLSIRRLDE